MTTGSFVDTRQTRNRVFLGIKGASFFSDYSMIHSAVVHFYMYSNYYSSSIGVFSLPCSSLGITEYFYNVFAPCFIILIDHALFRGGGS